METKHQVHNLIILDESGSMDSIKDSIIQGFNELVQTAKGMEKQFPDQEHFVSLISFNGLGQKILHFIDPVERLEQIDGHRYNPDASTPLYDAVGYAANKLKQALSGQTDYNVLVTILTDGRENASKEFSGSQIKKLVEELKQNFWTFTYIGTEHDIESAAVSISITNTMVFNKNADGIKSMFDKEKRARVAFSRKIRDKQETRDSYYDVEDEK